MENLPELCINVLKTNDQGSHTAPSANIYPHQWLWDSCFAAIGWAQIDTKRAKQEIFSLLDAQWDNGMIPHMVFGDESNSNRDSNLWRSWLAPEAPNKMRTSGITQPPLLAEAIQRIGKMLGAEERRHFYKKTVPKVIKYHEWLYTERDPHHEGLTLQIHPHETGIDNSPPWMRQMHEHSLPWWIALIEKLRVNKLINAVRPDTKSIPSNQRMPNMDALICWDIIRRLRRKHYDINKILHRTFFAIEDVAFNSILVRNNQILKELATDARIKLPRELEEIMQLSALTIEELWDETFAVYFSRDFTTDQLLRDPTIASLLPLYAGTIKTDRAKKLVAVLSNDHAFWLNFPLASVPRNMRYFDANRYWQGPTWINMNWLLIDGLKRMGFDKEATALKGHTLELIRQSGIWEYYNPQTGEGLGSADFSWTAALCLDLLSE